MKYLAVILLAASTVSADDSIDKSEIAKCGLIEGALERLQCFDSIAKRHSLDGVQKKKPNIDGSGKWSVNIDTNPLDDSTTVTAILTAESGADYLGRKVALIARCKSNTTDLYINWQDFLASNTTVISRIGKNSAETYKWSSSTDQTATFHRNPIDHLRKMFGEESYVAQITPYNSSPTTAIFDISGIENALRPLMNTCEWSKTQKPKQKKKVVVIEEAKKAPSKNSFYEQVSKYHSNYIRGLNDEFGGKVISYDNTELKFINLQYATNIWGCTSQDPNKIGEECIKINMLDMKRNKELLYTPSQIRKTGYTVINSKLK